MSTTVSFDGGVPRPIRLLTQNRELKAISVRNCPPPAWSVSPPTASPWPPNGWVVAGLVRAGRGRRRARCPSTPVHHARPRAARKRTRTRPRTAATTAGSVSGPHAMPGRPPHAGHHRAAPTTDGCRRGNADRLQSSIPRWPCVGLARSAGRVGPWRTQLTQLTQPAGHRRVPNSTQPPSSTPMLWRTKRDHAQLGWRVTVGASFKKPHPAPPHHPRAQPTTEGTPHPPTRHQGRSAATLPSGRTAHQHHRGHHAALRPTGRPRPPGQPARP
jgi:hypothetical protein